ncbi:hypothetical protein NWF32_25165 [Pseudomonas qingdaonensis]|nr:hypothetical protein [Pseudomonas qingdaonensis]
MTREDDWDGFGQRLSGSGTTRFEQVAVPEQHVLRRFKPGELRAESYISAFYQLFHLATLAGIARAALRDATAFVQGRTRAFGVPGQSSPKDDPLVQRVIGRLSSLAYASETLVLAAAEVLERVHQAELNDSAQEADYVEADIRTFQAQQIVLEQVLEVTTLLFEVGGASATSQARRLDRHWRNARTWPRTTRRSTASARWATTTSTASAPVLPGVRCMPRTAPPCATKPARCNRLHSGAAAMSQTARQMSIGMNILGFGAHASAWRKAEVPANAYLDVEYYRNIARISERGAWTRSSSPTARRWRATSPSTRPGAWNRPCC